MAFIKSGRFLATAISGLLAVVILSLAAWMIWGNDSGAAPDAEIVADGAVHIIPPVAESSTAEPADVDTPANTAAASPRPTEPPDEITVYITGAVVNPGVYVTTADQRLDAVLKMAGGPTQHADLNRINLAVYVTDAAHYRIPSTDDADDSPVNSAPYADNPVAEEPAEPTAALCAAPLDINTATAECLDTLPGIGAVRADAIVRHREEVGPFVSIDSITDVSGIGSGTYQKIADLITVSPR